jgi:hypothetical protein
LQRQQPEAMKHCDAESPGTFGLVHGGMIDKEI